MCYARFGLFEGAANDDEVSSPSCSNSRPSFGADTQMNQAVPCVSIKWKSQQGSDQLNSTRSQITKYDIILI